MANDSTNHPTSFSPRTRSGFLQYLHDNPNNRRISQAEKCNLIGWLTNPNTRPSSQKEFSRRHYARKKFAWDESRQSLLAVAQKDGEKDREVVTEDRIMDVVELVHTNTGHAGWDATWNEVRSSYYGILRADVIFLLKQCAICAPNPRKRPKGSTLTLTITNSQLADQNDLNHPLLIMDDLLHDDPLTSGFLQDEAHSGE
jgi:hypothetical protein